MSQLPSQTVGVFFPSMRHFHNKPLSSTTKYPMIIKLNIV